MPGFETGWQNGAPEYSLVADEIHLWRMDTESMPAAIDRLGDLLSPDERARADRFRFEIDRGRFILARGVLRILIGHYVGVEAGQIEFTYTPAGKPVLAAEFGNPLQFSVTHSRELALFAFTNGRNVGVDVEFIHPIPDAGAIANRFFSTIEIDQIEALEENQKMEAFYRCWTRKEAYVKALGSGLAHPLSEFDVSVAREPLAGLLAVRGSTEEAERWKIETIYPKPGAIAALIGEGRDWRCVCINVPATIQ